MGTGRMQEKAQMSREMNSRVQLLHRSVSLEPVFMLHFVLNCEKSVSACMNFDLYAE